MTYNPSLSSKINDFMRLEEARKIVETGTYYNARGLSSELERIKKVCDAIYYKNRNLELVPQALQLIYNALKPEIERQHALAKKDLLEELMKEG